MKFLKRTVKFIFIGNATVLLTLLFMPTFLITDQIDVFTGLMDYLWKQD